MIKSKFPKNETTIFSVMSALANKHNAINLSQGFPNFKIDAALKNYVKEALDKEQVQYAPMPGRLDLRQALSAKMKEQHGIYVNPETEITISAGATQGIYSAIAATIGFGDEVVLFDPAYDCYDPTIKLHGGIPVRLELDFPSYSINWEAVNNAVTAKTKMIIINNPHNPAGTVLKEIDIIELENLCRKHEDLIVLSDEVYEHIQFEGEHLSVLKNDFLRQRSFVTYSFGKTFHVTGWKIGYTVAPPEFTTELRETHQFNVFCVNTTMQYALCQYLNNTPSWREVKPLYTQKRELFLNGMKASRFKQLKSEGTYFCLFDYSAISNETDTDFAKRMTVDYGVASIPVSVFYENGTDHKVIRFCFAKTDETLNEAIEKLCKI
jgi:methionine aminotransferase